MRLSTYPSVHRRRRRRRTVTHCCTVPQVASHGVFIEVLLQLFNALPNGAYVQSRVFSGVRAVLCLGRAVPCRVSTRPSFVRCML
jgi:hypothetical protein